MRENNHVKQDINFLENPIWVLAEKSKTVELVIEQEHGTYKLTTQADSLPNKTDKVILYYLLLQVLKKEKGHSREIITTRYKIVKDVFSLRGKPGKTDYARLWKSLDRWTDVKVIFDGVFYEGSGYSKRIFHIIDDVVIDKKTKKIKLRFNQEYLEQIRNSNFCKYINYDDYKKLRKPISARLYEILSKTFKERKNWTIAILKLKEKLTFTEKYPSDILKKIKPGINEINAKTELKIKFDYNQETGICTFTKFDNTDLITISKPLEQKQIDYIIPEPILEIPKIKSSIISARKNNIENLAKQSILANFTELLKEHATPAVLQMLSEALKKHEQTYLISQIKYSIIHAKKNFAGHLAKGIEKDYAANDRQKDETKNEHTKKETLRKAEKQKAILKAKEEEEQKEKDFETEFLTWWNSASDDKKEEAKKELYPIEARQKWNERMQKIAYIRLKEKMKS